MVWCEVSHVKQWRPSNIQIAIYASNFHRTESSKNTYCNEHDKLFHWTEPKKWKLNILAFLSERWEFSPSLEVLKYILIGLNVYFSCSLLHWFRNLN